MTEKRLARANGMTFKVLALVLLQFQKAFRKKKKEGREKRAGAQGQGRESSTHIHTSRGGVRKVSVCGELA